MPKKKNKKKNLGQNGNSKEVYRPKSRSTNFQALREIKPETRHGILAVLSFVLVVFFLLASFSHAGRAGALVYDSLETLFGSGFYLLPLCFLLLGISFLRSLRPNFVLSRFLGGLLFFGASLAAISIIFGEESGGMVGGILAQPIVALFDFYFGLVFLGALIIIAALVIFDTDLALINRLFAALFRRKENEEEEDEEIVPSLPITPTIAEEKNPNDGKSDGQESDSKKTNKETNSKVNDSGLFAGLVNFGRRSHGEEAFVPPPLSLLGQDGGKPNVGDIKANSNIIKRALANFGINVEMDEISIGPSITRYALKPAEGVKLSRLVALQNDLALALAAHPLRIEAPIPGKSLVGIEIPNRTKSTVGLANLIGSKEYAESPHQLFVPLGKSVSGLPVFSNLAKAPHMLIAGATGSGKSVTIHSIITSLLYRNPAERLRFIMVDPKRVELTLYNKIPHLLTPVITEAKKAILALRWAAKEMDRRYDILESHAVRDIQSYHNNVLAKELAAASKTENGEAGATDDVERMPYIVIIIDELADIMTSYPRELEAAIVRLAQMSRAVGIHLIVSTQRPSVEVITGLIKANIPSRIALQVASQIDSRTILDMAGAEKLLGAGDMLYISGEMSKPVRLQSPFITEDEVKSVVNYLADNYGDHLPAEINFSGEEKAGTLISSALDGMGGDDSDDDLYEEARMAVLEAQKASASYLQRKLKVGYARAARLLDMLEERGVIGPGEGAKPREVFEKAGTITTDDGSEGENSY